jgi:ribosomal protein S18 acetylase RimI-like enzyme
MALQDFIVRHLQYSSLLERFSSEFMREHLGRKGFALGVFSQGALVGFRNVYFPGVQDPEWNLGRDIGLPGSQLTRVANLQMVCVHPDYRGNRLALKMNRIALRLLRQGGNHDHICATVSPLNIWNIAILLESGFHIRCVKPKYGGKMRYILYQRLKDPTQFCKKIKAAVVLNDLETQKRLLSAKYYAVDMVPRGKTKSTISADISLWDLIFRQPVEVPGVHATAKRVSAG